MSKRVVTVARTLGETSIEIASQGREGPGSKIRLTPEQIEQVKRTVCRTPEAIMKMSGGARDVRGAKAHFAYIDRNGQLPVLTDDGRELRGKEVAADVVGDWHLDLMRGQYCAKPAAGEKRRPKLVLNIVLSSPAGTPPQAVLEAVRDFARENFASRHRYAMVLHTDRENPHVHLVVKAEPEFEPGKRLNVDNAMLRRWRAQFAASLREHGVAVNATPRYMRGQVRTALKAPIFWLLRERRDYERLPADMRVRKARPTESTFMRAKVEGVARELQHGRLTPEPSKAKLLRQREVLVAGWRAVAQALRAQGQGELARDVDAYVATLPPVRTEKERIASGLLAQIQRLRQHERGVEAPPRERHREQKYR